MKKGDLDPRLIQCECDAWVRFEYHGEKIVCSSCGREHVNKGWKPVERGDPLRGVPYKDERGLP